MNIVAAICDDSFSDYNHLESLLSERNILTEVYQNGEELLQDLCDNNRHYDVFFLDMEMGKGMNGFETADAIAAINDTACFIFVTSYTEYIHECFRCNPVWFLTKPIAPEMLEKALSALSVRLSRHRKTYTFIRSEEHTSELQSRQY